MFYFVSFDVSAECAAFSS